MGASAKRSLGVNLGALVAVGTMAVGVGNRLFATRALAPNISAREREIRDGGGGTLIVLGAVIAAVTALAAHVGKESR